jgi:hypothetical protein
MPDARRSNAIGIKQARRTINRVLEPSYESLLSVVE